MIRTLLVLAAFALLPAAAQAARIVNVQPAASRGAADGLSGEISGQLNWSTGNTEVTQVSAGAAALYLHGQHRLYFAGRAAYGIDDGEAFVNNVFEHLRYRYRWTTAFGAESFVQHEFDEFRRLQLRALWGVGPRFDVPVPQPFELAFGTAWMLEYERVSDDAETDAGAEQLDQRWSSYLYLSATATPGIQLTHTAYVQPRFDDFGDWRLLSESAAVLDVKKWLAVKIAFTLAYDSRPPADVKKQDTAFGTSLLFRL